MTNDQQTDDVGDGKMTPLEPQAGALIDGVERALQMHGEMAPKAEPIVPINNFAAVLAAGVKTAYAKVSSFRPPLVLTAEQEFALLDASEPDQVDAQLKKNIRTFTSACLCLNGMTSSVSIRQLQNDTAFVPSTN